MCGIEMRAFMVGTPGMRTLLQLPLHWSQGLALRALSSPSSECFQQADSLSEERNTKELPNGQECQVGSFMFCHMSQRACLPCQLFETT